MIIKKNNFTLINLLKRLIKQLPSKRKIQFLFLVFIMIFSAFAEVLSIGLVIPFIGFLTKSGEIINNPFINKFAIKFGIYQESHLLLLTTLLFAITCLAASVIRLLTLYLNLRFSSVIGNDIGLKVYKNLLYQPYDFHLNINSSKFITNLLNDIGKIIGDVINPLLQSITSLFIALPLVLGLFYLNPKIAFSCFFIIMFIYCWVVFFTKNKIKKLSSIQDSTVTKLVKLLQEGIGGIRDILLNSVQSFYIKLYYESDFKLREAQAKGTFFASFPRYILEPIGITLIAFFGYYLVVVGRGSEAVPLLGVIALGAQRLLPMSQKVYEGLTTSRAALVQLSNIVDILERDNNVSKKIIDDNQFNLKKSIVFKDVSFRYSEGSKDVLKNINLFINKGEKIGIVGTTGGGKSTFLDLLTGLLKPTHGRILIDGKDINDPKNQLILLKWRSLISYVPQSIFLSDETINENIAFAVDSNLIIKKKVISSAKNAQIEQFIESLPNKYKTKVGERGIKLSGGQRQRIGIARALYKNSQVFVLDEATSALDSRTESLLIDSINNLSRKLTIIMVAHRLSTLENCDRIIQIEKGKVVTSENKKKL